MFATRSFQPAGHRAGLIALTVILASAPSAWAQTMSTTAELKQACETSPGNVVVIEQNTQIGTGPQWPLTGAVETKCTIVVDTLATLELNQVSLTFAGPLSIEGGVESRALFLESYVLAASVAVSFGDKAALLVERSQLSGTAGAISIAVGSEAALEVKGPLADPSLVSTETISISGGALLTAHITDAVLSARMGISASASGREGAMTFVSSMLETGEGSIDLRAFGDKSLVELKLGSFAAADAGVSVTLAGSESEFVANDFGIDGGRGNVTLSAAGSKGKLTIASGRIDALGVVSAQASIGGSEGYALIQGAVVTGGSRIEVESGLLSVFEVLNSSLISQGLVKIVTGSGGSCKSQDNVISAPRQQICTATVPNTGPTLGRRKGSRPSLGIDRR